MSSERAKDLYEWIVRDGEAAIEDLIASRESEAYFLDFKRSSDNGAGARLSQTDRANFAKAISGFGNSEGGVLIWGVECSGTQGQGDVAQTKYPVHDAPAFKARLEGVVSGCTVPGHEAVVSRAILSTEAARGYVVSHIPKSNRAPHQMIPDLRYFMRSGSAFVPVPHSVLAGMFGRRPQPRVFQNYILGVPEITGERVSVSCGISAYNDGPGVARDIYAVVTVLSTPGPNCQVRFETPDPNNWSGGFTFGMRISLVTREGYRVAPESHVQPVILHADFAPPFERDFRVQILLGCDGSSPYRDEWVKSVTDIEAAFAAIVGGQIADHDAATTLLGAQSSDADE